VLDFHKIINSEEKRRAASKRKFFLFGFLRFFALSFSQFRTDDAFGGGPTCSAYHQAQRGRGSSKQKSPQGCV
jgi:hypothetical protein